MSIFPRSLCHSSLSPICHEVSNINENVSVLNAVDLDKLWHYRLGHLPYNTMKNIADISIPASYKQHFPCEVFPMAKQSKPPFPISAITSKHCFDLIYIDTWGPYRVPTYKEEGYFLTIVDDFFGCTWTFLLSSKSYSFHTLKLFLALVERQFSIKVRIIRSDNAYELGAGEIPKAFFQSQGIIHQTTCVATP